MVSYFLTRVHRARSYSLCITAAPHGLVNIKYNRAMTVSMLSSFRMCYKALNSDLQQTAIGKGKGKIGGRGGGCWRKVNHT